METKLFEQYASIKSEIRQLEVMETSLKEKILEELYKVEKDKVEFDYGNFTVAYKKKWTYTDKVNRMEDNLKVEKVKEQEKGIADVEITNYLIFKANE